MKEALRSALNLSPGGRINDVFDVGSLEWRPHRPDVAHGVFGKAILTGDVKVTLIRVAPGGAFAAHCDTWGHLFLFLSGEGRAAVGERTFDVRAETVVTVPPGVTHSYENTGPADLTLVSMNLPPGAAGT